MKRTRVSRLMCIALVGLALGTAGCSGGGSSGGPGGSARSEMRRMILFAITTAGALSILARSMWRRRQVADFMGGTQAAE